MTLADLKAVIESDTNIAANLQVLFHNTLPLPNASKTLSDVGIGEGDVIVMQVRKVQAAGAGRQRAGPSSVRDDAEILRLQALGDPLIMKQLRQHRPELADVVKSPEQFRAVWGQFKRQQEAAEEEKEMMIAKLNADPFDVEAQAKIEEMIRETAVMQNLTEAMDHTPEAFGRVHMLYIPVEVNNRKLKAFVDSGAQATIMSPDCARECGIMRLLDKRYAGIARGVGTAKILGRVHAAQIKIGSLYLSCSFTVMEGKDVDLLLGLDMLKRHQACIDLRKNALVIMNDEVPFLGEADIPKGEILLGDEPTIEGPGGMQVGGRSGAIIPPETAQSVTQGKAAEGSSFHAPAAQLLIGGFPAAYVRQLMDLGFSQAEVVEALRMAGGNVEVAAGILYQ
ncbi:DNA damage-inducible protein 1 [Xylographa carneopallida]|nr:DNA damage-inducible protein 1 [Xylographa carneopallida]